MRKTISIFAALFLPLCLLAGERLSERVFIATDRDCYVAGDMVWCSAFCIDAATGRLSDFSAVAYVELYNADGPVACSKIALDGGRGAGCLQIPFSAPTGNCRIFAYTALQRSESGFDPAADAPVISVFNTFSTDRVKDGVVVTDDTAYSNAAPRPVASSSGLTATGVPGGVLLSNNTAGDVTVCASVERVDAVSAPEGAGLLLRFRNTMKPASAFTGPDVPEFAGEIVRLRAVGSDAAELTGQDLSAVVSVPGVKTDVYSARIGDDGRATVFSENIFGDRDLVCEIHGLRDGADCHLELESPFTAPAPLQVPQLLLAPCLSDALMSRTAAMHDDLASVPDTLYEVLPMRRNLLFPDKEHGSYNLDDYTRFPTLEEAFIEYMPDVRCRRDADGNPHISVLMSYAVHDPAQVWGASLMMIDGVPVFDHRKILEYDPSLVKTVEVYPYNYILGDETFGGVVNFVTFKGNIPTLTFDESVRIYDFKGAAYPMSYRGRHTLLWEPLLRLKAGEKRLLEFNCTEAVRIRCEGVGEDGGSVWVRKLSDN